MEINTTTRYKATRAAVHHTRKGQVFTGPARVTRRPLNSIEYKGTDAMVCEVCRASLKRSSTGSITKHSPGGYPVMVKRDMLACSGSFNISVEDASEEVFIINVLTRRRHN